MSTDTKTVDVEVLINSLSVPVSQIVFSHTINALPQVQFDLQLNNQNGGSTEINLPVFMKFCADQQNYLVNRFSTFGTGLTSEQATTKALRADLTIKATDGDGNVLNFSGFLSQPEFKVQQGEVDFTFNGVQSMAALQNLSFQIYSLTPNFAIRNLTLLTGSNESFNSIGTHVDTIIQEIFNQFETRLDSTSLNYTSLKGTHAINRQVYDKFLKTFLEISKGRTLIPLVNSDLPEGLKGSVQARADGEIERMLLGSQNFLAAVLDGLIPEFKFQMNADWNGKAWLEVIRTHEDPGTRFITAPIENIRFNVSAAIEAPLSRVYVRIGRLDSWATIDLTADNSNLKQLVAFPPVTEEEKKGGDPKLSPGVAYVVDAPSWIQDNVTTVDVLAPTEDDMTLELSFSKFRTQASSFSQQVLARQDILKWLAEFTFKEHFLRYTTASVTTPLNLLVEVGKTYQVKSPDGTLLFTGYLTSVTHSIALEQTSGSSKTSLQFSHIKATGVRFASIAESQFVAQVPGITPVDTFPSTPSAKRLPDAGP